MNVREFNEVWKALTPKKRHILYHRCRGATNQEIAKQVGTTEKAVRDHAVVIARMVTPERRWHGNRFDAVCFAMGQTLATRSKLMARKRNPLPPRVRKEAT